MKTVSKMSPLLEGARTDLLDEFLLPFLYVNNLGFDCVFSDKLVYVYFSLLSNPVFPFFSIIVRARSRLLYLLHRSMAWLSIPSCHHLH